MKKEITKVPLYINASVMDERNLYFTACNGNFLYKLNIDSNEIEKVYYLPIIANEAFRFVALSFYKENIWMIPWSDNYIYVYSVEKRELERYPIPYLCEEGIDGVKYRKPIREGKYLWLLPLKSKCIVRIDMELKVFEIFNEWPEGVYFPDNRKINFRMMCSYEGKLFLFRGDCSHNIILNMTTGEMEIWNIGIKNAFGTIADSRLYLAPIEKETEIRIFKLMGEKYIPQEQPVCADISQELSEDMKIYSYWYTERIGKTVFFMPHEANSILLADIKSGAISSVRVDIDEENTLRPNPEYAMYEVYGFRENYLVIPYMGNKLAIVSRDGLLKREVTLKVEPADIGKNRDMIQYEKGNNIYQYLMEDIAVHNRAWRNFQDSAALGITSSVGKIIYERVGKD